MKHTVVLLVSLLVAAALLAGCATAPASPAATSPAKPAATGASGPKGELQKTLVMSSSATGGSYIYTTAMGNLLNRYSTIKASQTVHTGSGQKFPAMMSGEADITPISALYPVTVALGGEGPEMQKKIRVRNLFAGGGLAASFMGVFTLPNKGIKSVKDLKGKKWVGEQKPTPQFGQISQALLKANGMTKADVQWLTIPSPPDAFKELKEGRIDAYTGTMGEGTTEMAQTTGLYLVPLTPQEQDEARKANPANQGGIVKKGTFGAPEDTPLIVSPTVWWVTERMSDLTAYTILKTIYDNNAEFAASHPSVAGFTLENALSVWALPYHSGSIYYFRERGLWGAAEDKKQADILKWEKETTGW